MEVRTELTEGGSPTVLFTQPAVVEVVGAGFDRLPNSHFESLRFPRIVKIHHDRSFLDSTDFESYQRMARQYRADNECWIEGEYDCWLKRLSPKTSVDDTCLPMSSQVSRDAAQTTSRTDFESDSDATRRHKQTASDLFICSDSKKLRKESPAADAPKGSLTLGDELVEIEET
jgi:hypothetical protein